MNILCGLTFSVVSMGGPIASLSATEGVVAREIAHHHYSAAIRSLLNEASPISPEEANLALYLAVYAGQFQEKLVSLLIKRGGDPRKSLNGLPPIIIVAGMWADASALRLLLDAKCDANSTWPENGWTALSAACFFQYPGWQDRVSLLLKDGADPNIGTVGGMTALMSTCLSGDSKVARQLIQFGANVSTRYQSDAIQTKGLSGWTAAHFGAAGWQGTNSSEFLKLSKLLTDSGASVFSKSATGATPIDLVGIPPSRSLLWLYSPRSAKWQ